MKDKRVIEEEEGKKETEQGVGGVVVGDRGCDFPTAQ